MKRLVLVVAALGMCACCKDKADSKGSKAPSKMAPAPKKDACEIWADRVFECFKDPRLEALALPQSEKAYFIKRCRGSWSHFAPKCLQYKRCGKITGCHEFLKREGKLK